MDQEQTYKWIQARLRELDSGSISEEDRLRLVDIALKDPFVADALEGFHAHPEADHDHHLNSIEQKITLTKRNRRSWLIPNLAVTAIAASFIIILATYAVLMRMDKDSNETEFVFVSPDSILISDPASGAVAMEDESRGAIEQEDANALTSNRADQPTSQQPPSATPTAEETFSNPTNSGVAKTNTTSPTGGNAKMNDATTFSDPKASSKSTKENANANQAQYTLTEKRLTGRVTDAATGLPLPYAPFLASNSNKLTFTDDQGNFEVMVSEPEVVLQIKSTGFEDTTFVLASNTDRATIALRTSTADKTQKSTRSSQSNNTAESQRTAITSYFAFSQYIASSSLIPLGTGITSTGKKVTVAFEVTSTGRPQKIKVVTSSGDKSYDAEAIRLINKGPDWVCSKGETSCVRSYTFYFQ